MDSRSARARRRRWCGSPRRSPGRRWRCPPDDLIARGALAAGRVRRPFLAVEAARQDARQGRLADAARAGEQDGVGHAVAADGVAQGRRDVVLAGDVVEPVRAPLACEYLVGSWGDLAFLVANAHCHADHAASRDRRAPPAAIETPLPLLPSGPDGVHEARIRSGPCDRGSLQGVRGRLTALPRGVKHPAWVLGAWSERGRRGIPSRTPRSGSLGLPFGSRGSAFSKRSEISGISSAGSRSW